jgi:hypothetical protein
MAVARIHLHSFYFLDSSTSESRKAGILKAYDSAINYVAALTSLNHEPEILLYLPNYHFRSLLTAASILLKVLKSSCSPQGVEEFERGRKAFNDSILTISTCSVSNNDTAGKAVKMLSNVWHSGSGEKEAAQLSVKSRYGAR